MSRNRMGIRTCNTTHRDCKTITNCPNCGAVITKPGKCEYCGTFIRIANSIDVGYTSAMVDMQINIWNGDEVTILPFKGFLNNITMEYPSLEVNSFDGRRGIVSGLPEVELTISGFINGDD